jgi:hypothetical protein
MFTPPETLTCSHCSKPLALGRGDLYFVEINAVADPSTPELEALAEAEIGDRLRALLKRLERTTEEEAMTQVAARKILYLCYQCYRQWIGNPTNRPD